MLFGILNIGFGLLGLLVALVVMVILPRMNTANNPILAQMHDSPLMKITMPLDAVANVGLVVAGCGLLLSKNWGRIISITYGIYAILEAVVAGIVTVSS